MISAVDVIRAKRDGEQLSDEQIDWVIDAYTRGVVADEQMAALAMAVTSATVRTPAAAPSPTIVRASVRASAGSRMNAPDPVLTSSTSAPAPSAIFLLMIELAISGTDSTVPVTSRSA